MTYAIRDPAPREDSPATARTAVTVPRSRAIHTRRESFDSDPVTGGRIPSDELVLRGVGCQESRGTHERGGARRAAGLL